jgi:uncharacterized protein with NRDE domain
LLLEPPRHPAAFIARHLRPQQPAPGHALAEGGKRLRAALAAQQVDSFDLLRILADREPADDDRRPDTGLPAGHERALSAIFIDAPDYGTRCSSLLGIDDLGRVEFIERSFASDGSVLGTERIAFEL